jgi:hypothetical protein
MQGGGRESSCTLIVAGFVGERKKKSRSITLGSPASQPFKQDLKHPQISQMTQIAIDGLTAEFDRRNTASS